MTTLVQSEIKVEDVIKPGGRAYLIGIGGVGMSGLAKVLKHFGMQVAGSDVKPGRETKTLIDMGIQVYPGHDLTRVEQQDVIIYSSAISMKNVERREAIMRGIPLLHRAEVLSFLMNHGISIAVTGTHGKTTTSAMIGFLLSHAGLKPTCLIGGRSLNFNSNALLGDSKFLVAEVDESDRSQLFYKPDFAVVTNLEEDHLDVYQSLDNLKTAFVDFVGGLKTTGHLIYSGHDKHLKEIAESIPNRINYGLSKTFRFGAEEITHRGFSSEFRLHENGRSVGRVRLNVPGKHNVLNAVGAIAALRTFGLSLSAILAGLAEFKGVGRRLEVKLERPDLMVIDDYAHHPTEVEASLAALRLLGKPVTVVFQPHRFSRTQYLGSALASSFSMAERVIFTEIYAAGEENVNAVDVKDVYEMAKRKHRAVSMISKSQILDYLASNHDTRTGVVAFLGAGDITEVADEFVQRVTLGT